MYRSRPRLRPRGSAGPPGRARVRADGYSRPPQPGRPAGAGPGTTGTHPIAFAPAATKPRIGWGSTSTGNGRNRPASLAGGPPSSGPAGGGQVRQFLPQGVVRRGIDSGRDPVGDVAARSRPRCDPSFGGDRSDTPSPTAAATASTGQPTKPWARARPSSPAETVRPARPSSWAGHRADHPVPDVVTRSRLDRSSSRGFGVSSSGGFFPYSRCGAYSWFNIFSDSGKVSADLHTICTCYNP